MSQDLVRAMDKRAIDRIIEHEGRKTFAIGTVKSLTLAGASVQVGGSVGYLSDVEAMQATDLSVGARVLLARITRQRWVILGAVEQKGKVTSKTTNTEPMATPASFAADDSGLGYANLEWDASYFDVHLHELQVGTISDGSHSDTETFLTDNSQYEYVANDGTYYARVRQVGPDWNRGAYTNWIAFSITSTGAVTDHGLLTGLGDDDHTQYALADGSRVAGDASDFTYTPGAASDWDGDVDPGDIDDALDELAFRISTLEAAPAVGDASDITYTPGVASDWDGGDPGNADDAFDELAERVQDLEDGGGGSLRATDLLSYMEPLTTGVVSDPEIVFADGDVIMVEVYF